MGLRPRGCEQARERKADRYGETHDYSPWRLEPALLMMPDSGGCA